MTSTTVSHAEVPELVSCNVVVTARPGHHAAARTLLEGLGALRSTGFAGVTLMRVGDPDDFPAALARRLAAQPRLSTSIAHAIPAEAVFLFKSQGELEDRLHDLLYEWASSAADKSFHVRLHTRGLRSAESTPELEARIAGFVFDALDARRSQARVEFDDPDVVFDIETVGRWAGAARITREQMQRYPFLAVR